MNKELLLNNIRIIQRGYLYDIYAYMSYMTDFELQYKGLDFFKLIDVIRNDYELEDTIIKEVIEFTKYQREIFPLFFFTILCEHMFVKLNHKYFDLSSFLIVVK